MSSSKTTKGFTSESSNIPVGETSPQSNKISILAKMAGKFNKSKAEEAVKQKKEEIYSAQQQDDELAQLIDSSNKVKKKFQNERAQEIFERELNNELTDIEELSLIAGSGVDGLYVNSIFHDGEEIKVIHVFGYPLKFLKSLITGPAVDDPFLWNRKKHEVPVVPGQIRSGKDVNADTICTTYVDTDINAYLSARNKDSGLTYVFSKIKPGSVIKAKPYDSFSHAGDGENHPQFLEDGQELLTPKELANKTGKKELNEITLRRYDETGSPLLPDAILLTSRYGIDEPSNKVLSQAIVFNIPIIHLDLEAYPEEDGYIPSNDVIKEIDEEISEGKDINEIVKETATDIDSVGKNIGFFLQRGCDEDVIKEKLQSDGDSTTWKNKLKLYGIET